jgi:hypothetical protein
MVQVNFLAKIDERLQKGFMAIGIRITRGLENDLTLLQVQIITQLGQKIDVVNINVQRVKEKINESLDSGFKRLYTEPTNNNNNGLGNMFENVRKMFFQNNELNNKEHESAKDLLNQGFEFISKLIVNEIERTDKSNEMKLTTIDGNIVIVYKEVDKLLRINETRSEAVRKEIQWIKRKIMVILVKSLNSSKIETNKTTIIIT